MLTEHRKRNYVIEANFFLICTRIMIGVMPPKFLFSLAKRRPRHVRRFASDEIEWVSWAIAKSAEGQWTPVADLAYALAAQMMLYRRGIPSRLCLGLSSSPHGPAARTWLECDDQIVFGRIDTETAIRVSTFGG
jgi:hypothetical protein